MKVEALSVSRIEDGDSKARKITLGLVTNGISKESFKHHQANR
jgi:hypothetical protein